MASPAEQAMTLLVAAGVGVLSGTGWHIKVGKEVDLPDTQIVLWDTGGGNPNTKWLLNFPSIQAQVRGSRNGYSEAWAKAKAVQDALLGLEPQDVSGDHWSGVTGLGDIAFLKYDGQDRPLFSVNFRVLHERASGTHRESL